MSLYKLKNQDGQNKIKILIAASLIICLLWHCIVGVDASKMHSTKKIKILKNEKNQGNGNVEKVHAKHKQKAKKINYLAEELQNILEKIKEEKRKQKNRKSKKKGNGKCRKDDKDKNIN